jgi:hypothetical protein
MMQWDDYFNHPFIQPFIQAGLVGENINHEAERESKALGKETLT